MSLYRLRATEVLTLLSHLYLHSQKRRHRHETHTKSLHGHRYVCLPCVIAAPFERPEDATAQINRASLPPEADLRASWSELADVTWPGFQARLPQFGELIGQIGLDEVEKNLGDFLARLGSLIDGAQGLLCGANSMAFRPV